MLITYRCSALHGNLSRPLIVKPFDETIVTKQAWCFTDIRERTSYTVVRNRYRKNRAAAAKYRNKRKDKAKRLEAIMEKVQAKHLLLSANAATLKDKVLELKNEILKHSSCNCDPITAYIQNAASRFV